ncbi:MAG: hypothetical protein MR902_07740 [Campylobacter sp.]|nr:hypothetical protein [Campylobacter sp.]
MQANGYEWKTFSSFNKGTTPRGYGDNSSLFSNPAYFLEVSYTKGSNLSLLSKTLVRNLTIADNIELNDRWSVLLSFTNSWINQKNFDNVSGVGKTKDISTNGQSYSANLMYNPLENLMIYIVCKSDHPTHIVMDELPRLIHLEVNSMKLV